MLIAITGVDCSGKTTQIQRLREHYEGLSISVCSVGLSHKPSARRVLEHSLVLCPHPEGFPFGLSGDHFAIALSCDFMNHYFDNVYPLLRPGGPDIVISDRYTLCYKAYSSAVGAESVISHSFLDSLVKPPDLQICLDIDLSTILDRLSHRAEPTAFDETTGMLESLIAYYRRAATLDPMLRVVDGAQPVDVVTNVLLSLIESRRHGKDF